MIHNRITARYAKTLFNAACEKKVLNEVFNDMRLLIRAYDENADLARFFRNPEIARAKRYAIFERLFKKKIDCLTFEFLCFLDKKDRLALIRHTCSDFLQLYFDHNDIIEVRIISASKLSKEMESKIIKKLEQKYKKHVHANIEVDTSLIGGFKVLMGDVTLNLSLKEQLNKLQDKMIYA